MPFVQGNVFDPEHITPTEPSYSAPSTSRPILAGLKSLNALRGHVSAIHVSAFFHLFGREQQIEAARALACLLSSTPGSMIFGVHSSRLVSGDRVNPLRNTKIYDFNAQDWSALWDGVIFKKGTVSVETELLDRSKFRPLTGMDGIPLVRSSSSHRLVWCVRRI